MKSSVSGLTAFRASVLSVVSITCLSLSLSSAWAVPVPLRHTRTLKLDGEGEAYRVNTAKIVIADYDLLRRDFAPLLKSLSDAEINAWLLEHAALIARTQYEKGEKANMNKAINADITHTTHYVRPHDYGRGFVFKVGNDGEQELLMDAKGVGAENPVAGSHSDGLGHVAEMIQEYAFEKLTHKAFVHSKSGLDTIETYAVIDLGFLAHKDGVWTAAGMVIRQAHKRYFRESRNGWIYFQLEDADAMKIERVIRRYGLTSSGIGYLREPDRKDSWHDMQGSDEGAVVDFGTFMAAKTFKDNLHGMDNSILIDYSSPDYVQPNPALCVSENDWAMHRDNSGQWVFGFSEWANPWVNSLRSGQKTQVEFATFLNGLLQNEVNKWNAYEAALASGQAGVAPVAAPSPFPSALPAVVSSPKPVVQPALVVQGPQPKPRAKHWWTRWWRALKN
jgi:hypothetical protein